MSRIKPLRWLRELKKLPEAKGWTIDLTNGDHVRLTHPDAANPVFAAKTPSDSRTIRNIRGDLRRAMKERQ